MADSQRPPPGPPPPVVPVASVEAARAAAASCASNIDGTLRRIASMSDPDRHRRVNDEWSAVESMRHLVLVIDLWLSKMILGHADPFDPMALPPTFMPPKLPGTSIDPDACPTFDEARDVLQRRIEQVCAYTDAVTDDDLGRAIDGHARTVAGALGVLFQELRAHDRFMNRDLDIIDGTPAT